MPSGVLGVVFFFFGGEGKRVGGLGWQLFFGGTSTIHYQMIRKEKQVAFGFGWTSVFETNMTSWLYLV